MAQLCKLFTLWPNKVNYEILVQILRVDRAITNTHSETFSEYLHNFLAQALQLMLCVVSRQMGEKKILHWNTCVNLSVADIVCDT